MMARIGDDSVVQMQGLRNAIQRLERALDRRHPVPAELSGREQTEIILEALRDIARRMQDLEMANGVDGVLG